MSGMIIAVVSVLQLTGADVVISVAGDTATVAAAYQMRETVDSVRVVLIRIPDQSLRVIAPSFVRPVVRRGLYEFTVASTARNTLSLRYRVSGDLRRIPVAIPSLPTMPGAGVVSIVVEGLPDSVALDDAFPRLIRQEAGRAAATLDNLPSFVRVTATSTVFSASNFTTVAALLLLVGSGLWWLRRRVLTRSRNDP